MLITLKHKETYFGLYTKKYHVHWFSSFKHLELRISIKIPVTIQIVYINMTAISPNLISWNMLLLSWSLHGSKHTVIMYVKMMDKKFLHTG